MKAKLLGVIAIAICAASLPVLAHHSFAAEFDQTKRVHLVGVVTKVEWQNPHAHFYLDVKEADGKLVNWDLETGSPNALSRRGVKRDSLQKGMTITVDGYRAKDGSNLASASTVTFPDGRNVFAGSADDGSPGSSNYK